MTIPRISAFHEADNAVLSCIRDRVLPKHRVIVDAPARIRHVLTVPSGGFRLDLVGHSEDGLLRFGNQPIDDAPSFITIFRELRAAGVTDVRFLGCVVGTTGRAAQVLATLNGTTGMPQFRGSVRTLDCKHYGHDGLLASVESGVFDFPAIGTTDAGFALSALLETIPSVASLSSETIVTPEQVALLEPHLSTYKTCCPSELGIETTAMTLKRFAMTLPQGFGRGRVVEQEGLLAVLVALSDKVEVAYVVKAARRGDARTIIDSWKRSEIPA